LAGTSSQSQAHAGGDAGTGCNSTVNADAHSAGHEEHGHPQYAIFYLLTAIVVGTLVSHVCTLPQFHGMQQTVVLFILGMIHSAIFEGLAINDKVFGASYLMWMHIDPHLLLFTMLPALLAGDAITIDTSVAAKVAQQCIYLAGPGVLMGAFGIALFLWAYFQWPFMLCLCTGAILSATDPVAVVGLLKELGASPTLTVQIQGESLLNDGTAIVLYLLAYDSIRGEVFQPGDVIIFLVKMALLAVFVGLLLGYVFLVWIRLSCKRFEHSAGLIQTTLTICCAYCSFVIAEGALHISGVLCTVSASLVLADKMWPSIVEKETMHHVWHMLEYLGNTIIFFLAGGLTGRILVNTDPVDFLHVLVLYLVATIVRGAIIFGSRPLLRFLSEVRQPVSLSDATVMTWGGLRGAVGLALAVQVKIGRIDDNISQKQADSVLFYTAGLACLTLLVNATTSPALVRWLGITHTPKAKQNMLLGLHAQMQRLEDSRVHPVVVHKAINEILNTAKEHVGHIVKPVKLRKQDSRFQVWKPKKYVRHPEELIGELLEARASWSSIPPRQAQLLDVPPLHDASYDESLIQAARQDPPEHIMIHAMNEAFLLLVRTQYWSLIDAGEFVAGSRDAEILLHSVRLGLDSADTELADLRHLRKRLTLVHEVTQAETMVDGPAEDAARERSRHSSRFTRISYQLEGDSNASGRGGPRSVSESVGEALCAENSRGWLQRLIRSQYFSAFMVVMIVLNAGYILVEQVYFSQPEDKSLWIWLAEIFFVGIFTLEFLMKFVALRCNYFKEGWNLFDFVLVIIGLVGLILEGIWQEMSGGDGENDMSQEARLFRVNRVFRVLRIVRIFRLVNFARALHAKLLKKDFSLELAEHLQSITVLRSFVKAHMAAQARLLEYFGCQGKADTPESALAVVQSQTQVYVALALLAKETDLVDPTIVRSLSIQRQIFSAAQDLSNFVLGAHEDGVITGRMAEMILHPVRDHMRVIDTMLQEVSSGMRSGSSVGMEAMPTTGAEDSVQIGCESEARQSVGQCEIPNLDGVTNDIPAKQETPMPGKLVMLQT